MLVWVYPVGNPKFIESFVEDPRFHRFLPPIDPHAEYLDLGLSDRSHDSISDHNSCALALELGGGGGEQVSLERRGREQPLPAPERLEQGGRHGAGQSSKASRGPWGHGRP